MAMPGLSQGGKGNSISSSEELQSTATNKQGNVNFNFGGTKSAAGLSINTWVLVAGLAVVGVYLLKGGK